MALLVVRFSQNEMKKLFIFVKTEQETIISNYSDLLRLHPLFHCALADGTGMTL